MLIFRKIKKYIKQLKPCFKMKNKDNKIEKSHMSFWGVGPLYGVLNILIIGTAMFFTFSYPEYFKFNISSILFYVFSALLIIWGLYLWIATGKQVDKCILKGVLATKGVYGIVRNPIYSGILFVISGICLMFESWLLLLCIPFSYIILKILLRKEDIILIEAFGEKYMQYKKQVNSILPKFSSIYSAFFYPIETQRITNNLFAIKDKDVNFFIYKTKNQYICFDTGYGSDKTAKEFSKIDLQAGAITTVFLTHSDPDHAKGLRLFSHAKLYFGKNELPLVKGEQGRIGIFYKNPTINRGYSLVEDEQIIEIDHTKIKTIYTNGHTIGHVCYLINDEILISGDAVVYQNGFLKPFYRPYSMKHKKTVASAKKVIELEDKVLICTAHTGLVAKKTKA